MTAQRNADQVSRRRFLGGMAALGGTAALVGCQTDIPSQGGDGGAVGKKGAKVTLDQWYHQYGEKGTHDAVVRYAKKFAKAHDDIAIDVGWTPGDYYGKLDTALLHGGPDVYEAHATIERVKAKECVSLDDIVTDDVKKDFYPGALEKETVDGTVYAVPMVVDVGMIYYRKSMLEKAGVEPPQTMDDVIAASKELTKGKVKGLFLGNDGGVGAMHLVLPWSAGVSFITDKKVSFDTDGTVAAFEKLVELNKSDSLLVGFTTDWFDPQAFVQGFCAMAWGGLWMMPVVQKELGDDFGVVPWPKMNGVSGATPATFIGGWSEMVSGKSKNQDQAKELVKWMWVDNADIQQDFNLSYGFHLPPRKSITKNAKDLQSGPALDAIDALEKYGQPTPPSPYWSGAMDTTLIDALGRMVKKGASVEAEVTKAAKKCGKELEKTLS